MDGEIEPRRQECRNIMGRKIILFFLPAIFLHLLPKKIPRLLIFTSLPVPQALRSLCLLLWKTQRRRALKKIRAIRVIRGYSGGK